MPKFSKQSQKAALDAVRTYNSMRTRAIKEFGLTNAPPKASINDLKSRASSTEELRSLIKTLKDYKTLKDFTPADIAIEGGVTRGELRTFKRISAAQKSAATREAKKIRQLMQTASPTEIMNLNYKLSAATAPRTSISALKTRELFSRTLESRRRSLLKFDTTGWERYRTNYVSRIYTLAAEAGVDTAIRDQIVNKLLSMGLSGFSQWAEWRGGNDLEFRYGSEAIRLLAGIADDLGLNLDLDFSEDIEF